MKMVIQIVATPGQKQSGSEMRWSVPEDRKFRSRQSRLATNSSRRNRARRQAQDEATAALIKWHREQQAGGQFAQEIEEARKALVSLNAELPKTAGLPSFFTVLATSTGINLLGLLPKSLKDVIDGTNELSDALRAADAEQRHFADDLLLQIGRQSALNAAFGQSPVAIARGEFAMMPHSRVIRSETSPKPSKTTTAPR